MTPNAKEHSDEVTIDINYFNEDWYKMYFGSVSLDGLHSALLFLLLHCLEGDISELCVTLSGADITVRHDGKPLEQSLDIEVVRAVCESFIYKDKQISLRFDKTIFKTTMLNNDALFDKLRELAFLNKDLRITYNGYSFNYENGLIDFYNYLHAKAGFCTYNTYMPIGFYAADGDMSVDVAFSCANSSHSPGILTYVNNQKTVKNGVHADGFIKALKHELRAYKQFSCEHISTLRNIDLGLIVHARTKNPSFEGALRQRLANPEICRFVFEVTKENLKQIFMENPEIASAFVKCWRCRK